jgi:tetratricopeptide (TPR) repeat protein
MRWLWIGISVAWAMPATAQTSPRPASLAELEATAQRDSLDPEALYRLALRYDNLKRYDDAGRLLRQVLAVDPRYAPAWLLLGYLPYDRRPKLWDEVTKNKVPAAWQDSVAESERLFHRAFLIDPLVDFRVMGAPPPKQDMVAIPDYGELTTVYLLYLGLSEFGWRYELTYDALNLYIQRQYKDKPTDSIPSGLFWLRGLAAAHLSSYGRAIPDIQILLDRSLKHEASDSLIQLDLNTNDYRYLLALLKQRAKRPADAMSLYQEALANDLGLYMAHVRLARLYAEVHMWPEAIEEARRAVAANPDDPSLLLDLAEVLRDGGQLEEAESTFQQAQRSNGRNPRIVYELGLVEQQLDKPAEAKVALARFIAIAPSRMGAEVADAKQRLATLP